MDFDQLKKEINNPDGLRRLQEFKEETKINGDDPIWAYIFVLENYQRIYEQMPAKLGELAAAESKLIASKAISKIQNEASEAVRSAILERSEFEKNLALAKSGLFFLLTLAVCVVLSGVFIGAVRVVESSGLSLLKTIYFLPIGHVFIAGWVTIFLVWAFRWFEGARGARRDRVM